MEKAMQQSHGMSYATYEQSLEKRIQVEREREKDYQQCNNLRFEQHNKMI